MRGVGPGTVLGGRYTVHERLDQVRDTERWSADDSTLGRPVSVLTIDVADQRTPALLDAARRAASVSHSVFVRLLDVGTDGEVSYLVEEDLSDASTLADLVDDGGIPGDEVRRITGEVAAALESARQRGMHHLDLTPADVLRTPEGDVRVRGLEVAAVRAGEEATDADDAARRDAVGVVALAYAGLTGLWPLGAGGAGLAPAPRVPAGVASPSEIAAGVPRDLDALCRLTLNDDQGPTSPGDYARQVAPWPSRQVIGRPVTPMAPPPQVDAEDAPAPEATPTEATPTEATADEATADHGTPDEATDTSADEAPAAEPAAEHGSRRGLAALAGLTGAAGAAAAAGGAVSGRGTADPVGGAGPSSADGIGHEPTRVLRRDEPPSWLSGDTGAVGAAEGERGAPSGGRRSEPTPAWTAAAVDDTRDRALSPREPTRVEDLPADGEPSTGERVGAGAVAAGAAVASALGTVGGRVSGMARRAVDKVSELSPDTQPGMREADDDLEAPAPMVPAEPLTKDESKLALGIVAAFLILALVVGIYGVSKIGQGSEDIFGLSGAPITRTTTIGPSTSSATSTPDGSGEPLAILKVQSYDPQGDGHEHDELVGKVYDGNLDTGWYSESYSSSDFGGLKSGVGLVVDLGPNKKPNEVTLTIPHKSAVQVWVGPDARLEGATKIGEKDPAEGTVKFPVPAKVDGQYIIIWYTKVYPDSKGDIRAWLNEVVVTG